MKPREDKGCVDGRLNVYGTQNLKVAGKPTPRYNGIPNSSRLVDLSVIPGNVGANTNSTALVLGEKAAVLIAEDLGLKLE